MLIDYLLIYPASRQVDAGLKVLIATALICVLSPIKLSPVEGIPITLQTLVILVLGMILGGKKGVLAVGLYLFLGGMGLPVFSGGSYGWEKLLGNTGGFLISFVFAAGLVGIMGSGRWGLKWYNIALSLLTGHVLILIMGFMWFGYIEGYEGIIQRVYPLLPGLYLKIIIGTIILVLSNATMKLLIRKYYKR